MDSRSGPELPHKVHGFDETVKVSSPERPWPRAEAPAHAGGAILLAILASALLHSCGADTKTVEGTLAGAASAVGSRDYDALFQVLDERARSALSSVYHARQRAAEVIRASYPPDLQSSALAELGDAVEATSSVDLFRRRCGELCMETFARLLGAPREVHEQGSLHVVKTVRGTELTLYRGEDGAYGLMWETQALVRERIRAAAELDLVQKNGELYRSQRALQEPRH